MALNFSLNLGHPRKKNKNLIGDAITVEQFKELAQCNNFRIQKSKEKFHKSGNPVSYFVCGNYSGLVSEKLATKLWNNQPYGLILIQEVICYDGIHRILAFEREEYYEDSDNKLIDRMVTVEEFKRLAGCQSFVIKKSKDKFYNSGNPISYFYCGKYSGLVSKELANKMWTRQPFGTVLIREINDRLIAFEQNTTKVNIDGININQLVDNCYDAIPEHWRQKPWLYLNHGKAVLESEDQLNAYIAAYGEMHIIKCQIAMQNFPFEHLVFSKNEKDEITRVRSFEIYDWGCGQGIGSLVLMEMLHKRDMLCGLHCITLIEPSRAALSRAECWIKQSAPAATEIRVINRYIPANNQPLWNDLERHAPIAIHICSNILDIDEVGLKWLAQMSSSISSLNIFICVGPQYGQGISRISDFHNYLGSPSCFTDISEYPCAYTSRTMHPFGIEAKCFVIDSTVGFNTKYIEQSKQTYIDEYYDE